MTEITAAKLVAYGFVIQPNNQYCDVIAKKGRVNVFHFNGRPPVWKCYVRPYQFPGNANPVSSMEEIHSILDISES
jgi:hypothetical protein